MPNITNGKIHFTTTLFPSFIFSYESAGGRLFFHLFGALAEFERDLIRERVQANAIK
ncbi:MAG: recombinase family protein, partial [Desulfamplus sp.]|nr:recombinase family protein [Desulfamplus sp.]